MDNKQVHDAMAYLDPQLIEEAAVPAARSPRKLRPMLLAACLCLLIAIPVMAVTGSLLVENYYGSSIPDNLSDQDLDAFFRAETADKVPVSAFSPDALQTAAEQGPGPGYYGFDTWAEAEAFLGVNILDSDLIDSSRSTPVELYDADGQIVLNDACHLTLVNNEDTLLYGVYLSYFFHKDGGGTIALQANAVTDQNPNENDSSIGVSYEDSDILEQTSEGYLTASGTEATIIRTRDSAGTWDFDGWMLKNGFILRFTLSSNHEEGGVDTIKALLDAVK